MNFGAATYGLGVIAGALSTLSPCVLPLVPVLLASAINAHRWGALALGAGLALSFTIVGIFLATLGASLVLDPAPFRVVGGVRGGPGCVVCPACLRSCAALCGQLGGPGGPGRRAEPKHGRGIGRGETI